MCRPTSKEQTEAHDFKKDVLNMSREGRQVSETRWSALFHGVSTESVERHTYTIGSFEKGRLHARSGEE